MVRIDNQKDSGFETSKLAIDVIRHLTTLSTGTVLLIIAIHDKGAVSGHSTQISMLAMSGSLLFSLTYLFLVGIWGVESRSWIMVLIAALSFMLFVFGISFFAGAMSVRLLNS